jgi:putative transposase
VPLWSAKIRYVIHDRDCIYSEDVDRTLTGLGLTVLRTPARAPQANAFCERLVGTIRRECLDYMIPLDERHLREVLAQWVLQYNRGRPHAKLGPGIPDPPRDQVVAQSSGHRLPAGCRVVATPILGGLHYDYRFTPTAA